MLGAIPGDRGINGQYKRGIAGVFCPFDTAGGDFLSTNEIQLIPTRSWRGGADFFQVGPRQCGERAYRPGFTDRLGSDGFSAGPEHAGTAYRGGDNRQRNGVSQDFSPHLYCVKLDRTSWLKAFSLKSFDIISERDFVIGTATIIFPHNRWHALLHHLTEMIYGDAFFDRSGPALRTSGMSPPEVGLQQPQPGRVLIESWGLRSTSCHIEWLLSTVRPFWAVGLRCANPIYDSRREP